MDLGQEFRLNLLGSFRLFAPGGERIEIASKKGIAILAMLAVADDGERTRDWLQDRLWGSRQRPQAQSSLRRELANLRKALNEHGPPILDCGHHLVRLDLARMHIDVLALRSGDGGQSGRLGAGEFLEGLDIAGETGFQEWLRDQRRRLEALAGRRAQSVESPADRRRADATGSVAIVSIGVAGPDPSGGNAARDQPRLTELVHKILTALARDQNGRPVAGPQGEARFAFGEVRRAVAFAAALQVRNEAQPAWLERNRHLRLRVGIGAGDLIEEGGQARGEAVAIASGLQRAAAAGAVLLSDSVQVALVDPLDPAVLQVDTIAIAGLAKPLVAYQLDLRIDKRAPRLAGPLSTRILDMSRPTPGFGDRPALAVLPFANLTDDPANDYLCEGISEDLIDRVSRLRWLPVIARTSSFSFTGGKLDPRVIGQSLGAKYLLEGRLRSTAGAFAVTAALSEAASGYTLWSERHELPLNRSQNTLDQLVAGLVGVLDARIDYAEQARARDKQQTRMNINDLIWRGRWHLNRLTRADSEMSRALFAEALEREPNSPEALIQATFALGWTIWARRGTDTEVMEMRRLAQQAIIADPEDGRGHMLAGIAEMWLRQPTRARTLLERAIALNPSLVQAHAQFGCHHNLVGNPSTAIVSLQTAMRLSPNDIHIFFILGEVAMSHVLLGRWAEAIEHADQSLIRRPAYWYAHMLKINALARGGDVRAAAAAVDEMLALKPDFSLQFLDWIPFLDRTRNDYLKEGLTMVAPGLRNHVEKGDIGLRA